jgi:hypothetical protein
MKTRRLTPAEHNARLSNGVCPRCGDYRLIRVLRTKDDGMGGSKFAGAYWSCGGPRGHECYHLSGETGTTLAESSDGVDPLELDRPVPPPPPVIRRPKKEQA